MKIRRILRRVGLGLLVLVAAFAVVTWSRRARKFPVPALRLHATRDPAVIARGRYIVTGPGHCSDCHGESTGPALGKSEPLSGGYEFRLPVGVFRAPNITSDALTGNGRYSDQELMRILRYGVRPDGTAVLPFMPFANLADDDLVAVISYLRATEPVQRVIAPHEPNLLGSLVKAWILTPRGPESVPAPSAPRGATIENGHYLAHHVANCVACHTKMDMRTGALIGPVFGGGAEHQSSTDPSKKFIAPNLTPDPRWGWIVGWSTEAFSARLRSGVGREGSPMPWSHFKQLSDEDARAIYLYLQSLPKAEGGPDPRQRNSVLEVASRAP